MPRPKVHPANRLRANTACTACRASKKRCSGYFPCTNCIHKGCGRSCTPFKSLSHAGLRSPLVPASRPTVEAPRTRRGVSVESQSLLTSQSHDIGTPRVEPDTPEVGSHSPEVTHRTHPRMLRNLQGERGMNVCDRHAYHLIDTVRSVRREGRLSIIPTIASGYSDPTYWALAVLS